MRTQQERQTRAVSATGVTIVAGALALTAGAVWAPVAALGIAAFLLAYGALLVVIWHHRRPRMIRTTASQLLLSLAPVVLLTLVFPLASKHFEGHTVGGTPLGTLLLASSLTVPWLSQSVCMPLYRGLGDRSVGARAVDDRFLRIWPAVLIQSLPVIAVFAVPVTAFLRLSPTALGAYLLLALSHAAFAQLLVVANSADRRREWAVAWAAYAAALIVAPTMWLLPPLVGIAVQLFFLRRSLHVLPGAILRPVRMQDRDVAGDLLRGLLLGAVLWGDKFVLFLVLDGQIAVQTIFTALLPAVLAYNVYFVRLAPAFDAAVATVRGAMAGEEYAVLSRRSRELSDTVGLTVFRTGATAAISGVVVIALVARYAPESLGLAVAVMLASWLLLMTTVLCYKLDYIGRRGIAQLLSGIHLVACLVAFTVPGLDTAGAYLLMAALDVPIAIAALVAVRRQWSNAEFTLFWRLATAW